MNRDYLYQLAFEFKKTKLWKKLWSSLLFAVQFSDGTIGYCSVSDDMCDLDIGLSVYFENGLHNFYQFLSDDPHLPWERLESRMRRNALICAFRCKDEMPPQNLEEMQAYCKANKIRLSGANACPSLERLMPYRLPWSVEGRDEIILAEALEAALEVAKKLKNSRPEVLGFKNAPTADIEIPLLQKQGDKFVWKRHKTPKTTAPKLPSPRIRDELLVSRVKKQKKTQNVWNCALVMHPKAMVNKKPEAFEQLREAPFFSMVFFVQDNETGAILGNSVNPMYPDEAQTFCTQLLNLMLEHGRPASINAYDARVCQLVEKAAAQVGVTVRSDEPIPMAHNMLLDYYRSFNSPYVDDFYDDDEDDEELSEMDKMLDQIDLGDMPDDMLKELMHALIEKPLSPSITLKIFDEWLNRFLS